MIIFSGVAGSGKSVQGRMLADRLSLPWLSTGEFLRMIISGERRAHMLEGHLLEDSEIIGVMQKVLTLIDTNKEFVLDGFPRTERQAEWIIENPAVKKTCVVHLQAPKDVVRARLMQRGRKDDHAEAIDKRFDEYEHMIQPILRQFEQAGVAVLDVDATDAIDMIHERIVEVVATEMKDPALERGIS